MQARADRCATKNAAWAYLLVPYMPLARIFYTAKQGSHQHILRRRRRKSPQSRIHRPHDGFNTSTDRRLAHDAAERGVGRRPTVRDGAEELPRLISTNEEQPTVDLVRERRRPFSSLHHNLPGAAAPRLEVRVHGARDRGGARPLAMCQRQQRLEVRGRRRGC